MRAFRAVGGENWVGVNATTNEYRRVPSLKFHDHYGSADRTDDDDEGPQEL